VGGQLLLQTKKNGLLLRQPSHTNPPRPPDRNLGGSPRTCQTYNQKKSKKKGRSQGSDEPTNRRRKKNFPFSKGTDPQPIREITWPTSNKRTGNYQDSRDKRPVGKIREPRKKQVLRPWKARIVIDQGEVDVPKELRELQSRIGSHAGVQAGTPDLNGGTRAGRLDGRLGKIQSRKGKHVKRILTTTDALGPLLM